MGWQVKGKRSTVILQVLDANLSTVGRVAKLSNAIEGRHMAVDFWKRPVRLSVHWQEACSNYRSEEWSLGIWAAATLHSESMMFDPQPTSGGTGIPRGISVARPGTRERERLQLRAH